MAHSLTHVLPYTHPHTFHKPLTMSKQTGIITFWESKNNYGQLIQCFALQYYLRKKGYSPFLIRYRQTQHPATFRISNLLNYVLHLPKYIRIYLAASTLRKQYGRYGHPEADQQRQFDAFIARHLVCSPEIYDEESIHACPPHADAYICGSDQIWGIDLAYFLSFAPEKSPKIAYAASWGGIKHLETHYAAQVTQCLKSFRFVGVREQSGVELCSKLGIKSQKVADPTLLLEVADYDKIRIPVRRKRPYMFVYLLGSTIACPVSEIMDFARKMNWDVVYVASQDRYDEYPKTNAQIGEWIDGLAQAELVVTNSFHCTVFSLLYERKFMTIPLTGKYRRMNTRIEELLAACHLEQAIYKHNWEEVYHSPFDFSSFRSYHEQCRNESGKLLLDALP